VSASWERYVSSVDSTEAAQKKKKRSYLCSTTFRLGSNSPKGRYELQRITSRVCDRSERKSDRQAIVLNNVDQLPRVPIAERLTGRNRLPRERETVKCGPARYFGNRRDPRTNVEAGGVCRQDGDLRAGIDIPPRAVRLVWINKLPFPPSPIRGAPPVGPK